MATFPIQLEDDLAELLRQRARDKGVEPSTIVAEAVRALLAKPSDEFRETVEHALHRNAELYRRLA